VCFATNLGVAAEVELAAVNLRFAVETEFPAADYHSLPNCVSCSEIVIRCRN